MTSAEFCISLCQWHTSDQEQIPDLLQRAFVEGGFTDGARAQVIFNIDALQTRGQMLVARRHTDHGIVGTVLLAAHDSPYRQIANPGEAELQLLAVDSKYRGQGAGYSLLAAAEILAKTQSAEKIVLSTQSLMHDAQRLYERRHFVRTPKRDWCRGDRQFLAYTKVLA